MWILVLRQQAERSGEQHGRRKEKNMGVPSGGRPRGGCDRGHLLLQRAAGAGNRRIPYQALRTVRDSNAGRHPVGRSGNPGGMLCLLIQRSISKATGMWK